MTTTHALGLVALSAALLGGGLPLTARADHDTVAKGILLRLPEKWRSRLKPGRMTDMFLHKASHFPDNGSPSLIPPCDREWLAAHGAKTPFDYHRAPKWMLVFDRLVRAIERDDAEAYFFYVGTLSHQICDADSCNHDHLMHLLYCCWSPRAFSPSLALDCGWVESRPDAKKVFFDRVAALDGLDAWAGKSPEEVYRALYGLKWAGCQTCADLSQSLSQRAIDFALEKSDANAMALAEGLTDIGAWAVKHTLLACAAAERFAAAGNFPEVDFKALASRFEREDGRAWAERPVSADAYAREFDEDPSHPAKVRVLYDASAYFASGVIANAQVPQSCQIVGSLRKIRPDLTSSLMSIRDASRAFPDPAKVPLVVVPGRGLVGFMGFDVDGFKKAAAAYSAKGGRIIWLDGDGFARIAAAKPLADVRRVRRDPRRPGSWVWPEPLPVLMKSTYRWLADGSVTEWSYRREPAHPTGWMWSASPFWFDEARFPSDAIRLAELVTPGEFANKDPRKIVAVAIPAKNPTFVYLPNNLIFPYMMTDEKPQLKPLALRLDSVGEKVLGDVLKVLGM